MVQVERRRSLTGIRRWGPYAPLVIMILANGLELWTRVSMPSETMTGHDYFTMVAQGGICVVCSILLLVCLYLQFVPATSESKACVIEKSPKDLEAKEVETAVCAEPTEKKRQRRAGQSLHHRRHPTVVQGLPRNRFRRIE